MTGHILLLGPSGSGKSTIAAAMRGYLHIELDGTSRNPPRRRPPIASRLRTRLERGLTIRGAEFDAISFGHFSREWRSFLVGDATPLIEELHRRAERARATACVVSFPSGVVFSATQIEVAERAGMNVKILYGSEDDCIRAFLEREAKTGRGLDAGHWRRYNAETYRAMGRDEYAPYRVLAFTMNGERPLIDDCLRVILRRVDDEGSSREPAMEDPSLRSG